jgi:Domain of Unknown Function (DUF1080)
MGVNGNSINWARAARRTCAPLRVKVNTTPMSRYMIRANLAAFTLSLSCLSGAVLHAQSVGDGFTSMFNGRDLSGWEGLAPFWKVENGAIVGETKAANEQTVFLYWTGGEPADFELRYRVRIVGEGNSGVQIRSRRTPNWNALGYQVDYDASGYNVGSLYHYGRQPSATFAQRGDSVMIDSTGKKSVTRFADTNKLLEGFRKGDWNEFRVLARGRRVTLWMNGVEMCSAEDYEREFAAPRGIIALQLHSGAPMRVEYKDLSIRMY